MDAAEAREERVKAKAARDEAKAKYDAAPLTGPEHAELKENWLRAEVALAQAHLNSVVVEGTTSGPVFDLAVTALADAKAQRDKVTGAAASGLFFALSFARALICFVSRPQADCRVHRAHGQIFATGDEKEAGFSGQLVAISHAR